MKAALGQNVKVSLPKAFQTNKQQTKSRAVKRVPTDISDSEFKEFLDLNKITFAKVECLKSKKDGRVLPIFRLEISDPTEADLSSHFTKSSMSCNRHSIQGGGISSPHFNYAVLQLPMFRTFSKMCESKQKCLIFGENHSHRGCPSGESRKPICANCNGPHVASYKGCPEYKKQAFRQHVVNNRKQTPLL